MGKYTDDEIRAMPKITAKIAADYLGISPMMVTLGMICNLQGNKIRSRSHFLSRLTGSYIPQPEKKILNCWNMRKRVKSTLMGDKAADSQI